VNESKTENLLHNLLKFVEHFTGSGLQSLCEKFKLAKLKVQCLSLVFRRQGISKWPKAVVPSQGCETSFQGVWEVSVLMTGDWSVYFSPVVACLLLQFVKDESARFVETSKVNMCHHTRPFVWFSLHIKFLNSFRNVWKIALDFKLQRVSSQNKKFLGVQKAKTGVPGLKSLRWKVCLNLRVYQSYKDIKGMQCALPYSFTQTLPLCDAKRFFRKFKKPKWSSSGFFHIPQIMLTEKNLVITQQTQCSWSKIWWRFCSGCCILIHLNSVAGIRKLVSFFIRIVYTRAVVWRFLSRGKNEIVCLFECIDRTFSIRSARTQLSPRRSVIDSIDSNSRESLKIDKWNFEKILVPWTSLGFSLCADLLLG